MPVNPAPRAASAAKRKTPRTEAASKETMDKRVMTKTLPISFEFFPPKTPEGAAKLRATRAALYPHQPEFCSVTFGAGGSTQEGTFAAV